MTARLSHAGRIVAVSCNRARTVIVLFLLVVTLAVAYTAQHFAMTTDTLELISADLPWRKNKANFEEAFPQLSDLIVVAASGVRVRLTGSIVLADEEFSSLTEHVAVMATATVVTVLLMLWLAVRSVYMMASIVISTLTGLILTTALGLFAFGRFNLISVAFIPVFVGLGVDFAIQFTVRFRLEHVAYADRETALAVTGGAVGRSLALAAAAIAAEFFAHSHSIGQASFYSTLRFDLGFNPDRGQSSPSIGSGKYLRQSGRKQALHIEHLPIGTWPNGRKSSDMPDTLVERSRS